jgi:hypothetical protein
MAVVWVVDMVEALATVEAQAMAVVMVDSMDFSADGKAFQLE